ncbi:MAG: BBP7 family outer membrane beta-barrel protein, partial [Planctomycetales bacterium]|nr:BBP7 family outer membrane beta-barrel protein [Planctomycetales bacterium]
PGLLTGNIRVDADSTIDSAGGRFRWNLCCRQLACRVPDCGGCGSCTLPPNGYSKLDFILGYRYFGLDETLTINESLMTQTAPFGSIRIDDSYAVNNNFHGGELGFVWEGAWRRWTLEMLSKVALGGVQQEAILDGSTVISEVGGGTQTFPGGLLVLDPITYDRTQFGVLPELGATLGCYLTPRLRATVGYTFMFLSPVIRPGNVINTTVNGDAVNAPLTGGGTEVPEFVLNETHLWLQGLNVGLDLRW